MAAADFEEGYDTEVAHASASIGTSRTAPGDYEEEFFTQPATPTVLTPAAAEAGLRLAGRLLALKTPCLPLTVTQHSARWQIATDAGFEDLKLDTGMREAGGDVGADTLAWYPERMRVLDGTDAIEYRAARGETLYVRCRVRATTGLESSWSAAVSFTMETATLTGTTWKDAQ